MWIFHSKVSTVRLHRLSTSTGLQDVNDKGPVIFATAGVFPLEEYELSSKDKWLFGGQMGMEWGFQNQDNFKFAVAYYDYENIEAIPNTSPSGTCELNTEENDSSVPQFMQGGNTLATICREGTQTAPGVFPGLVGLASDYNIININGSYDIAAFAPVHVRLSGDYAKNIGFNGQNVSRLAGGNVAEETTAWQARLDVGWPQVDKAGHWNTFAAYKKVGRDAVLDAFTDSDFHLGGTNAKGWFVGANYGLMNGVWLTGRWLSADIISGPPFGIDLLQVDINTRF
jgi:Putative porin